MENFGDYGYYYNLFYEKKDYNREAKVIDSILKKYGHKNHSLLNMGCGTGRHDIALNKMGYQCSGIDISETMVGIARENAKYIGAEIDFQVHDIKTYETKKSYDAVLSLFHVMSYQNTNEDISAAFRAARKAVKKDGIFLFDVWYGPGVLSLPPSLRVKTVEDEKNRVIRIANPVMHDTINIVDVNYEVLVINKKNSVVKTINEVHSMRYFFTPEIRQFLEEAGFELLDSLDCESLGKTSFASWTSYYVAKAV